MNGVDDGMGHTENLKRRNVAPAMSEEEEEAFLEKLLAPKEGEEESDDSDDEISQYTGRAYLARRRKPDTWACIALQVVLVIFAIGLVLYAIFYFEHMHVNILKAYAHLGYDTAQHELANRYLHGVGVEKHEETAMHWFKQAADQGHPVASYNLAIGHLKGIKTPINRTQVKGLIEHAANNDVNEAKMAWGNLCSSGGCD